MAKEYTPLESAQMHASICEDLWRETIKERDTAQEAAETYHEAWQDSAVYWKERVAKLEYDLERVQHDLDASQMLRALESATLVNVCKGLCRERDEVRERLDREPRLSDAIRKDRDEALDKIARLEAQLAERIDMISDLSEAHVKVQVKWGADVDRLDTMLDGVIEIMKGVCPIAVRRELQALVDRIVSDLERNPRL